jgi:diadenosine tetraphosphatase ApaH/serine/threonine PP2A family protein phosphatase
LAYPLTAIISDLHSNAPALETALADARERGARRVVCLGDVIGYGSRPRECLETVMRLCTDEPRPANGEWPAGLAGGLCLLGNHEEALLGSAEDFNPRARAALEWTREELNREADPARRAAVWDWLGALAPAASDGVASFAHGSPRDPVREYLLPRDIKDQAKMRANFDALQCGVCFVGHSHVPAVYAEDGRLHRPQGTEESLDLAAAATRVIINVGSVGQPRDGDPRLSYVLFDGLRVTFVRLDYDVAGAMQDIRRIRELPDYLAERLAVGR